MLLLVMFDSFVIDLLVLGTWKPAFLHVPKEVTLDSMKIHVKRTFQFGWVFIIPIVLLVSLAYLALL